MHPRISKKKNFNMKNTLQARFFHETKCAAGMTYRTKCAAGQIFSVNLDG